MGEPSALQTGLHTVLQLMLVGGLFAAACGATYWGGRISKGMEQLQKTTQDHEGRLRSGGL